MYNNNKKSQSNLGRATLPPLMQRMDSSAAFATSCAMPTGDESNHSATDMLHPHCSATSSYTLDLHCVSPKQDLPLPTGRYPPHCLKSHSPAHLTHHPKQHNQPTYTELLRLFPYDKLVRTGVWSLRFSDTSVLEHIGP